MRYARHAQKLQPDGNDFAKQALSYTYQHAKPYFTATNQATPNGSPLTVHG